VTVRYVIGDTLAVTRTIPDASVDLVITSPPFLALRSYLPDDHPDKALELGSEPNPAAFIDMLLELTAEWRRVLAPHGTLAVELGDTYSGSTGGGGDIDNIKAGRTQQSSVGQWRSSQPIQNRGEANTVIRKGDGWPLAKSLALIPELYRVALAYGINPLTGQESPAGRWRVRNNVTWCRPNPPVGQLGDKFRPSTSDLVIACTSDKRWFDLDAVRHQAPDQGVKTTNGPKAKAKAVDRTIAGTHSAFDVRTNSNPAGAPPLDHWVIPPGGYKGAHYATWPAALLEKPIEACCPRRVCRTCGTPSRRLTESERVTVGTQTPGKIGALAESGAYASHGDTSVTTIGWASCDCPDTDGIRLDGYHTGTGWRPGHVLDPFGGSGTTGVVASGRSRDCTLIDLDDRNAELARERLGMFLEVETHQPEAVA
jgi:site-specific DNA-methyltransferase (adenine-specific)